MNELTKELKAVVIRNGIEIWLEADKVEKLIAILSSPNAPQFITFEGKLLNKADISGIFSAQDMENLTRRKNGQWKCEVAGVWHERGEKCECAYKKRMEEQAERTRKMLEDRNK